ncbi:MAG: phosphoglycerate kinase [Candidatus Micrarchaeia archaeon]
MSDFYNIDDFDFKGKTVFVRVDVNCPIDQNGKIIVSERFAAHARTIKELLEKNAKVVVLAHQGRPKQPDLIPLSQHAKALSEHVGRDVKYVDDHYGQKAQGVIKSLSGGEIILLENMRMLEEEMLKLSPAKHAQSKLVQSLYPLAQIFVCDAFSAAHRSQASVVGFAKVLPSCAGRVMQSEYYNAQKVCGEPAHPNVYLLGGSKPDESFQLMKKALADGTVDFVLLSGVIANAALLAKGVRMGGPTEEFLRKKEYTHFVDEFKQLIASHGKKIVTPLDLAFEENGQRKEALVGSLPQDKAFFDIGRKTAEFFSKKVSEAKTVYLKGPQGVFEKDVFGFGTKAVLQAIASSSAFSFTGGGHTSAALDKFGISRDKISFRSLAGGALLKMLEGKKLPAIEVLRENKRLFRPV